MSDKLEGLREARAACVGVGLGAHEAAQAKDATDYVAGYQDGCVDCDEAIRALEQQQAAPSAGQTDSQTPETDAFYAELYDARTPSDMVDAASGKEREKMASLERRLADAQRELAEAKKRGDLYFTDLVKKDSRIRILEASRSASTPTFATGKGRWSTALYFSDYWWVKKSHAENAVKDAFELAAQRCEQAKRGLGAADRRSRMADLCAHAIRSIEPATTPVSSITRATYRCSTCGVECLEAVSAITERKD